MIADHDCVAVGERDGDDHAFFVEEGSVGAAEVDDKVFAVGEESEHGVAAGDLGVLERDVVGVGAADCHESIAGMLAGAVRRGYMKRSCHVGHGTGGSRCDARSGEGWAHALLGGPCAGDACRAASVRAVAADLAAPASLARGARIHMRRRHVPPCGKQQARRLCPQSYASVGQPKPPCGSHSRDLPDGRITGCIVECRAAALPRGCR